MDWHTFTIMIPWPALSAGWIAAYMTAGNAVLLWLLWLNFSEYDDFESDRGIANIVASKSSARGLKYVAAVVMLWPLVVASLFFMKWFERSGRLKEYERKMRWQLDDDI